MQRPAADRFSSQNMSDCEFCSSGGRRFRTTRQCTQCARFLCLICRPWVPQRGFLCPDCGGGPCEDAIHQPAAAVERIKAAGFSAPYWLLVLQQRVQITDPETVAEEIVPE